MKERGVNWGTKLETLCGELNITLGSLAYQIHQPLWALDYIAKENRTPPKALLEAIALRFDVNPKWLVGEEEAPILLSKRYVRSQENEIADRFFMLKGDMGDYDFAVKTGISVNVIRDLRSAEREMMDRTAESVAYYCNVSVDWLLCGDETSKSAPCDMQMITFLKKNENIRQLVAACMEEKTARHNEIVVTTPTSVNARLQEIIDNRALTVENISEATDTEADIVTSYIMGTQEIPNLWVKRFCKAYSISNKWLSTGEGRKEYLRNADTLGNGKNTAGARVRALRKELGLTQSEFAGKLSVTLGLIALVETGRASLTARVAAEISQAYGVREEWLLTGEGEKMLEASEK